MINELERKWKEEVMIYTRLCQEFAGGTEENYYKPQDRRLSG
jgi:hypothetical protein